MGLSHKQMVDHIESGTPVIYKGQVIDKVEDLPTEIELAGNDPVKLQQALNALNDDERRIQANRAALLNKLGRSAATSTQSGATTETGATTEGGGEGGTEAGGDTAKTSTKAKSATGKAKTGTEAADAISKEESVEKSSA